MNSPQAPDEGRTTKVRKVMAAVATLAALVLGGGAGVSGI
jgi:hypothetical protein